MRDGEKKVDVWIGELMTVAEFGALLRAVVWAAVHRREAWYFQSEFQAALDEGEGE